jgi:hypothetical protein
MSTFTTIKTAIRDATVMLSVLEGIPGAKVSQNIRLKRKDWGSMAVDFFVELSSASSSDRLVGPFVRNGLKYFYVTREADGTLALHINQDQIDHLDIEREISSALSAHRRDEVAQLEQAVRQKRDEALRAIESIAEAQRSRLAGAQRQASETAIRDSVQISTAQAVQGSDPHAVLAEAAKVLARLDSQAASKQRQTQEQLSASSDGISKADGDAMTAKLTQEYARQKVLEQLDQIEQQYGVRLSGESILDDGTIQITLRG